MVKRAAFGSRRKLGSKSSPDNVASGSNKDFMELGTEQKLEQLSQEIKGLKTLLAGMSKSGNLQGTEDDYRQHYTTFVANTLHDIDQIRGELKKATNFKYVHPDTKLTGAAKNRRVYGLAHRAMPVQPSLVFWESHYGAGMVCSPAALFDYVVSRPEYDHLEHVWVITDDNERERMEIRFRAMRNVSFIKGGSADYFETLAVAGYVIGNVSLPSVFSKRDGQIVVNTWHSVTVKTLGFDQPNGIVETRNVLRSFLATDFIVSPNPFMTSIYNSSYKLSGLFPGKIIETGFPRVDYLFKTNKDELIRDLEERGVVIEPDKTIVLFAPTWRGEKVGLAEADHRGFSLMMRSAKKRLDPEKYQLLVKPHNLTYKAMIKAGADVTGLVPPDVDANRLLSLVDVLISDYSSIYYDFLPTSRPVLFYIPDMKKYTAERGLVLELEDLPGPTTKSAAQICAWINDDCKVMEEYRDNYAANLKLANPFDDGNASARVAKEVFAKRKSTRPTAKKASKKKRVLIYGGSFQMNGVTTTLLTLLKLLDYSKVDVTLYVPVPAGKINAKLLSWVPEEVRILVRFDTHTSTLSEDRKIKKFLIGELPESSYADPDLQHAFLREYRRCFGNAQFDYTIDYSGYSLYWPAVLAQAPNAKCFIWQHNELARDFGNQVKRSATAALRGLPSLASMSGMYRFVDKVVSCGEDVSALNKAAMALPATEDKFVFATNVIDFERVRQGMVNRYCFTKTMNDRYSPEKKRTAVRIDRENGTVRTAGHFYGDVSPSNGSGWKATNTKVPLPEVDNINFVTMGRFSSEKNHMALIKAFSEFCTGNPNSRLYIIGDGALFSAYETLIESLDLQNRVHLTGGLKNPFGLASLCDCFVLPSLYEGMPIAPLEARIMGLPIIMAAFGSVSSVAVDGGQLIVDTTQEGLLEGLQAFEAGQVPPSVSFSSTEYNSKGLGEFLKLIDLKL